MAVYTIRPEFTITLGSVTYLGGENVDLDAIQFELHKHKLEGVEANVLPMETGTGTGSSLPITANSVNLSAQTISLLGSEIDTAEKAIALLAVRGNYQTFRSAEISYVDGALLAFPHNWTNFDPATDWYDAQLWAVCVSSELGYSVGDRIRIVTVRCTVIATETQFLVQTNPDGLNGTSRDTVPAIVNFTTSNWQVYLQAIRKV